MSHGPQTIQQVVDRLRKMMGHAGAKDKVALREGVAAIMELGLENVRLRKELETLSNYLDANKRAYPMLPMSESEVRGIQDAAGVRGLGEIKIYDEEALTDGATQP